MPELPKTGTLHRETFHVSTGDTITFPGLPPVLSTPALVWHLEHAAMCLIEPFLEPGQITLGTQIEIDHTAAALLGDEIDCIATVVRAVDAELTFRVEAYHSNRSLGRGLHRRRIVSVEKLQRKLAR